MSRGRAGSGVNGWWVGSIEVQVWKPGGQVDNEFVTDVHSQARFLTPRPPHRYVCPACDQPHLPTTQPFDTRNAKLHPHNRLQTNNRRPNKKTNSLSDRGAHRRIVMRKKRRAPAKRANTTTIGIHGRGHGGMTMSSHRALDLSRLSVRVPCLLGVSLFIVALVVGVARRVSKKMFSFFASHTSTYNSSVDRCDPRTTPDRRLSCVPGNRHLDIHMGE